MPNIVKGTGNKNSPLIAFVADWPTIEEDRTRNTCIGATRDKLSYLLKGIGLSINDIYYTNMVQLRPERNFVSDEELGIWSKRISKELMEVNPRIIVPLGNSALKGVSGKESITKWRGSIISSTFNGISGNPIKVIPTHHPIDIFKQYSLNPIVKIDFQKIKRELHTVDIPAIKRNYILRPTFTQTMEYLEKLKAEAEYICFDIETNYMPMVSCLGLAGWTTEAISIPFYYNSGNYWTQLSHEMEIWKSIAELWKMDKKFVAQNAMFDCSYLARYHGLWPKAGIYMDTMLAQHACYPEFEKSLAFLCSIYTNEPYHKDEGKGVKGNAKDWDAYWLYNAKDCTTTLEICHALEREIKDVGVERINKQMHDLIKPLLTMMMQGAPIDTTFVKEYDAELNETIKKADDELTNILGRSINVKSTNDMQWLLYEYLRLPVRHKRRPNGKMSITTDAETISAFASSNPHPALDVIETVRKNRTLKSFLKKSTDPYDGRMRCDYKITGTETGRLSSRESHFGCGGNLQNIPAKGPMRKMFVVDKGKKAGYTDLSQAELWIVAAKAKEEVMFEALKKGDAHSALVPDVFGIPIERSRELHPTHSAGWTYRDICKRFGHACDYLSDIDRDRQGYIVGVNKLSTIIKMDKNFTQGIVETYFLKRPGVVRWHREVENALKYKGFLETVYGRKRYFFGRYDTNLHRIGYAYEPQSTVGDHLNAGLINVQNKLGKYVDILLQVHDAIYWQADENIFDDIKHEVEKCMLLPLVINGYEFTIPVDTGVGYNWAEVH